MTGITQRRPERRRTTEDGERERETEDARARDRCPECRSSVVDDGGERVCTDCGLVVRETEIDRGPEWRAYDQRDREQKSRVGAPTSRTMHDKGLTTTIDWQDRDAYGNALSTEKRSQIQRLRTWQERLRTKDARERNLQFAFGEIDRMAGALGVPESVHEIACTVYRRALEDDLIRGRSIEGVATAALYVACRQERLPRSFDEIAAVSRIDQVDIGRTYRYLCRELGVNVRPIDPASYLPRYCSALDLGEPVREQATEVLEAAEEAGLLSGRSPTGVAAAAIYVAAGLSGEKRTQAEISEVADVSDVTIRNRYQEQVEALGVV